MSKTALALFTLVVSTSCSPSAPEEDVQFVLLGKTRNYRQSEAGTVTFLNTVYFGEIFLNEGGIASDGFVTGPGDAERGLYFGDQEVPFLAGNRHTSIEALEEQYPDGTYFFNFDTPHGNVRDLPVTFSKHGLESRFPSPVEISMHQNGQEAIPSAIDPSHDLLVTWNEFDRGAADPNGIIDDMIYVIMGGTTISSRGGVLGDGHRPPEKPGDHRHLRDVNVLGYQHYGNRRAGKGVPGATICYGWWADRPDEAVALTTPQ